MKIKKIFFLILLFVLLFSFGLSFAQEIKYPSLPGVEPPQIFLKKIEQGIYPQGEAFLLYLKYFLHFFFFVSAPILLVVLIWGGISYLTSADSVVKRKEAKERVLFGFLGILLLFFSYLILGIISPQFAIFRPFELLKKGEYEETLVEELEPPILSFVELPIEGLIENVLCSEKLCQGGLGADDIRSQIKCGYSRGDNLDFCDCKQVEAIKYQIIGDKVEIKYTQDTEGNSIPQTQKMCLIDAVYYIGKGYVTQFKYVNDKIKNEANKVWNAILTCQCTPGCWNLTESLGCTGDSCIPTKDFVGCVDDPKNNRKNLRRLINMDLKEDEEKNLDYETLKILYKQVGNLRCFLYEELFKLEKNDLLLSGCSFQYDVVRATSQPELKNYEIEIEEMGGPKIKLYKLYETLDTNKLIGDLKGLTQLDLDDIKSILSIENRQKLYTIWRDLRGFILYAPDSPTNFYCQKTDEFKTLHQDAEKKAYANLLGISGEDLEKFDNAGLIEKFKMFLRYLGRLSVAVRCHPIPTSILGTFPPDKEDLETFFSAEKAQEISKKMDSFSEFLKKTPPEDIELKIEDFILEIKDFKEIISDYLLNFLGNKPL